MTDTTPTAAFHAHLDECERCANQPFFLCPRGAALLRAAGSELSGVSPREIETADRKSQ